jgi:endonuclease/exonuclease/phosphatase (EEP) superfamily protein YafD
MPRYAESGLTDVPAPADGRPGRLARLTARWSWLVLFLSAVGTGSACLGNFTWWLDLFTHFRAQYFFAAVLLLILFACVRSKRGALLSAVLVVMNGASIGPLYLSPDPPPTTGPPLRLLLANVHSGNQEFQLLLDLVAAERPDLLLFEEVTAVWVDALAPLSTEYPHQITRPSEDNFGIMLWSRIPLDRAEVQFFGAADVASIVARFRHGGQSINLLLTHPLPPMQARLAQLRDGQLMEVAAAARKLGPRTIVAGDLNVTPWSPIFSRLLDVSGLRDSTRGFGIQPTWPIVLPAPCRIPIDHCLHTSDLAVTDRRTGPHIGSDHLPLIIDLR